MPQLTVMNRAFIHFKDMRLPGVRKCVFDTDPSAGSDQRAGGSNTFDKLSTGNLQVGEPPDLNERDSILKNYTDNVNNTMKTIIVITLNEAFAGNTSLGLIPCLYNTYYSLSDRMRNTAGFIFDLT